MTNIQYYKATFFILTIKMPLNYFFNTKYSIKELKETQYVIYITTSSSLNINKIVTVLERKKRIFEIKTLI